MSALTRPRGRLPRRVYWVRRLLVMGVAPALVFSLVFGIAHALGAGGGGGGEAATPVVGAPRESASAGQATDSADSTGDRVTEEQAKVSHGKKHRKKVLAQPDGPCADSDVLITPEISDAHAGSPIEVVLRLSTVESEACTWEVSPESVFVSITSEKGPVWSSQQCPDAVPTEDVVPRREKSAKVVLTWNGKESDSACSDFTKWVWPGSYTASAVARGSVTPIDVGFVLQSAVAPTVTVTPTPTPTDKPGSGSRTDGPER